ncbi:glycerate kinase [Nocardia sp. KC 131]|uniref:glycerate kinase family protein n=1 Tax=Nocardia arseniciresistens TaxID=3392119 RepID=UPI00398F009A
MLSSHRWHHPLSSIARRSAAPDTRRAMALVCPDKFRGSATATQVSRYLADGLRSGGYIGDIVCLPVADGGEGTIDCFVAAGFATTEATVAGPLEAHVTARIATQDRVAVIESAQASGLDLIAATPGNARHASSRGVGELIKYVLDLGFRDITVGVGGTASTDGGAGMLQALGVRLLDRTGHPISRGGVGLLQLHHVDMTGLDARLYDARITVATDVTNPLTGPDGAARKFARQKGAENSDVTLLDTGIEHFARILTPYVLPAAAEQLGAGAGGGIGYALIGVCGATRVSGADAILDLLHLDEHMSRAHLVITGEGSLDESSLAGKAPTAIARRAKSHDTTTVAVVGRCSLIEKDWREAGFADVYELAAMAGSVEASMRRTSELLIEAGRRIA